MSFSIRHQTIQPIKHVFVGAVLTVLLLAANAFGRALIPTVSFPFGAADGAVFADVFGDGRQELVLGGSKGIEVYAPPDGRGRTLWQPVAQLPPLPAPVTSVAVADVVGDGVPDIIAGTAQAGSVYVLRRTGTGWVVFAQTPYMWSPIRTVYAADMTGDGRGEIVALSDEGNVVVYGWQRPVLEPLWQLPQDYGPIVDIVVADVLGEGTSQLVLTEENGRLSVWRWPLDEPVWQTFVWGFPTALAVTANDDGHRGELVVTTSERLLYRYRWDGERFIAVGSPLNDARLPFQWIVPAQIPGDSNSYLLAYNDEGLGLWRLVSTTLSRIDEGWADNPMWALQVPGTDSFVVGEARHAVSVWERRPTDEFTVVVDGIERGLDDPPLFRGSQVMLSARDWEKLLGMQLFWEQSERRLTFVRGYHYAIAVVDEWEVILPTGRRSVTIAPTILNGRTYMPPEFPAWFGLDYRWDARERRLEVRSR